MTRNPINIGIVGGTGKMGRWFQRFFSAAGHSVRIAGRTTALTPVELAKQSQVFIVTVPIAVTCATIRELGPYLSPDALFMDFTSLKKEPVEAMLQSSQSEVIGSHPLFGPGQRSLKGKNIVLCPARGKRWLPWLQGLFETHGAHVEIMDPDEHDRAMAVVQGLIHTAHMAMGLTMEQSTFSFSEFRSMATPNFTKKVRQVQRLFRQDPSLYAQMLFYNPHALPVLESYSGRLHVLVEAVRRKDFATIKDTFAAVGDYLARE